MLIQPFCFVVSSLSAISDFLASFPSPFYNLKRVKLPRGYKASSMSSALRSYLLGGSPRATVVTTLSQVNSEFVCLLDTIMLKYPETFEHFSTKSKKLCTMNLNMLCTSLNDFTKISMTEVDSEMIAGYKDVYAYLQNQGLDVSWAVNRLNYIEQLRFSKPLIPELHAIDCCINDAKSKVQDLQARVDDAKTQLQDAQTLRMQKMTEIEKAFGTMGTKLAVGFIGDDILSGSDCLNF